MNFVVGFTDWLKTRKSLSVFVENSVKEILEEKDISI